MTTMRRAACILILLTACSAEVQPPEAPAKESAVLPGLLANLLLSDASDEITPVMFTHAAHADPNVPERPGNCSNCHHDLKDDPQAIPRPCTACHPLEPEDTGPPDL
jgi:hypothetical protein